MKEPSVFHESGELGSESRRYLVALARSFYRAFPNIVSSPMTQSHLLTWTHYQALLKEHDDDRPTIGIVLCSETNDDIARYSMLHGSEQLFASEYRLYLPTKEQLKREIEVQKEIFRQQQEGLFDPENGEDE